MAEFLGVVELGTLYKGGEALPLPTRPWRTNNYVGQLSDRGRGDTPKFSGSMDDWIIGNTLNTANTKLKWIKIKDEDKIIFVCDRVILNYISWDILNNAGYVTGKEITIDSIKYKCRLLTGGSSYRSGSSNSGGKLPNEWDKYIENLDNISGLPNPTSDDLDNKWTYDDLDGTHNQLWHWVGNYSWCQEVYSSNSSYRVYRGGSSARYFDYNSARSSESDIGWRPVLEALSPLKYKKYLLKQNNQYYSIKPEFYNSLTGQYMPVDKNFQDNGFDNIEDLTKEVNGFKPISKFKGKIEILKQDEK